LDGTSTRTDARRAAAVAVVVAASAAGCATVASEPLDGQAGTADEAVEVQPGTADQAVDEIDTADRGVDGQAGSADQPVEGQVAHSSSGIGALDHVLIATAVVDIDVVSVAPFDPEVDEHFPTITAVVTDAVSGDVAGLGLDVAAPVPLRVLSTAGLEPGGTYRAFVNSSPASDPPLRIGFALTPDGDPAPGYDDPAAVAALDRIVEATGQDPTGALLTLLARYGDDDDPVVRALSDLGR
jgi:hypothetical protein